MCDPCMEVSVEIRAFGHGVHCRLHLEHWLQQMNVLSHVGFLLQMYICHLAESSGDAEILELKQHKRTLEVMQLEAMKSCSPAETRQAGPAEPPPNVSRCDAETQEEGVPQHGSLHDGLPSLPIDVEETGRNAMSPSDAASDSPSASEAPADRAGPKALRQSFVIPRMMRPRSRSKAFSISPASHVQHFRDWGFPSFPQDASDSS